METQVENTSQTAVEVQSNKPKGFWGKANAFLDKNYALIFAPIIVFILYTVGLYIYDVYPFGDEYTAASYDLSAQICPFIEHLFDVMDGKSTLTYSYAIVGGADVTGSFLYFFLSPFSFLFLVCGDGRVAYASAIVMIYKLMTVAFSGTWFAKKVFKDIPDYIAIGLGVVYTYCGYMFVSNTYINWVDFLIYMPFCVGAFKHFVKTNKFLPFSILVACCIYTCFSIACFSLFTVFPALIVYALLCVEKERKNKFIAYLCLAFVVALLLALPVLLPALVAFLNSARGGGIFDKLWYGFTLAEETSLPTDFASSSQFIDSYTQSLYRKWSYILSDTLFVVLTVVWFFRKGLKDKFAQFMLVVGGFTLLPTVVDEAMNLMNMGSYMSYALRFGFLNAIYFFGGACLCIEGLCHKPWNAYDGSALFGGKKRIKYTLLEDMPSMQQADEISNVELEDEQGMYALNEENPPIKEKKTIREKAPRRAMPYIWMSLIIVVGLLMTTLLLVFVLNGRYKDFWAKVIDDSEQLKSLNSFASRFAHSLGGLEVIGVVSFLVAVVVILGCFLVWRKRISVRILTYVLTVVVGSQVVFYNSQLVVGNRSTQHVTLGHYQTLSQQLNEMDDSYFRIKDYKEKVTACAPFTGNSNSFSVFSSVIDADNFACYQIFGYDGNGKNSFKSAHSDNKNNRADEFGDAFFGYKYFFVQKSKRKEVEKKKYLKKVLVENEDGKKEHLHSGDYYIYENTIVFPIGFTVERGDYKFVKPNTNNRTYRKYNQNELYTFLGGKKEKFDKVSQDMVTDLSAQLWERAAEVDVGAGQITAKVKAEAGECLWLNFVASDGYTVTVNGKKAELIENDLCFLSVELEEGENVVEFVYSSPYVKYAAVGIGGMLLGLLVVALVLKKTKLIDTLSPVISWAGIGVATLVVGFFMVLPTCAFMSKIIALIVL